MTAVSMELRFRARVVRAVGSLLGTLVVVATACGDGGGGAASVAPLELNQRIEAATAPFVLDVRGLWEFRTGHVPGAVNIPFSELHQRTDDIAYWADREVVVYGEGSLQADQAAELLTKRGFKQVKRLIGDMQGWRRNGLPEERS